jgi:hypothetical protein
LCKSVIFFDFEVPDLCIIFGLQKINVIMLKRISLLLIALFCLHICQAGMPINSFAPSAPDKVFNCNLPAPGNLEVTDATPTSLSFEWDPVAGTNGYHVLLTEVATGDPVYANDIPNEFITINGLLPNTEYQFTVYSVCQNGGWGGFSSINAVTDFVIIDDVTSNLEYPSYRTIQTHNLFLDTPNSQPSIGFRVYGPDNRFTDFVTEKDLGVMVDDIYNHHVRVKHENGTIEDKAEWLFEADSVSTGVPFCPSQCSLASVGVRVLRFDKDKGRHEPVLRMEFSPRNHGNSILYVVPAFNGYQVKVGEYIRSKGSANTNNQPLIQTSPNPFMDNLMVMLNTTEEAQISLLDMVTGRTIYQTKWTGGEQLNIPTHDMPAGAYLVRCESLSETKTIKVIKSRNQ